VSILENTGAVILAGGKALRMHGRDKALQLLHGRSLITHVIDNLQRQLPLLIISVNHNTGLYADFDLPVVRDIKSDYAGPLAGIHAAMNWYRGRSGSEPITHLAVFPADVPRFPANTAVLLASAFKESPGLEISWLQTGEQLQPLFSMWSMSLLPELDIALSRNVYSPMRFIQSRRNRLIQINRFQADEFVNVNTLSALEALEELR